MKVSITVKVGRLTLSTDLKPALVEQIEANAKQTGRGVQSIIIGAIDNGSDALARQLSRREIGDGSHGIGADLEHLRYARQLLDGYCQDSAEAAAENLDTFIKELKEHLVELNEGEPDGYWTDAEDGSHWCDKCIEKEPFGVIGRERKAPGPDESWWCRRCAEKLEAAS